MQLSREEKVLAESAYARLQRGNSRPYIAIIAIVAPSMATTFHGTRSQQETIVLTGIMALCLGAGVVVTYFTSSQRKHDEILVRLFEKHFPEDCSWKQEEKILAQAEDIRLKAKVDYLIHKQA